MAATPLRARIAAVLDYPRRYLYHPRLAPLLDDVGRGRLNRLYQSFLDRFLPDHRRQITAGCCTATFHVSNGIEFTVLQNAVMQHHSERAILEDLLGELRDDDVFYDIGANIGMYTCLAGSTIQDGKIVAFEPFEKNADRLQENIELNGQQARTTVKELALSDTDGEHTFDVKVDRIGSVGPALDSHEGTAITVRTRRLDTLIEEGLTPPTVIKIDVEGAERKVLDGMDQLLEGQQCRLIYCEVHPHLLEDCTTDDIRSLLEENGYSVEELHARDVPFLKARARDRKT